MTDTSPALDRITPPMREPVSDYLKLLDGLMGKNLRVVTLFGAIAGGFFDTQRHVVRNVMVLESVDLGALKRLSDEGVRLGRAGMAAPLVMTPAYVRDSLDTFPLELLDIHLCHITVIGEDLFADLTFQDADVRLQCERELKTVLIGLRQGLLAAAGRDKILGAMEVDAGEGLIRTLRGLLWLKGMKDPLPSRKVLGEIEKRTERRYEGIRTALNPSSPRSWDTFQALYRDVETLGNIADAL